MVLGILAALIAALIACLGFIIGFAQYPDTDLGPLLAVWVGVGSAAAWAVASTCNSSNPLGSWFNLFAAVFAATSLGYLTPAELFCRQIKDNQGNPSRWKGEDWLTYRLCEFRLMPATSSTNTDAPAIAMRDLVSRLDQIDQKVGTHEWFRERLAELMGDHERRLRQIEELDRKPIAPTDSPNPSPPIALPSAATPPPARP